MSKSDDIAIKVSGVSKTFRLPHEKHTSMKSAFLSAVRQSKGYELQEALKDVSFEVKQGEFFGIVGRNGSGKSTLLKCIAGVYTPNKGKIHINGKLVPFIELGVGFNPELSGRDNVFLNGALLGFSRKEMEAMYDEIVEFAELEAFMDQKLKNYSSGMQVRLAFSIAIRAKGDVLLLDEVLAVGDESFQRKCYEYFAEIRKNKQTVILVTHGMDTVRQFCDRAILLNKGVLVDEGTPLKITQAYKKLNESENITIDSDDANNTTEANRYADVKVDYREEGGTLKFSVDVNPKQDLDDSIIAVEIFKSNGDPVIRWVTDENAKDRLNLKQGEKTTLEVSFQDIFPVGKFSVRVQIKSRDRSKEYVVLNDVVVFEVRNKTQYTYNRLWQPDTEYVLKVGNDKVR